MVERSFVGPVKLETAKFKWTGVLSLFSEIIATKCLAPSQAASMWHMPDSYWYCVYTVAQRYMVVRPIPAIAYTTYR